MKQHIKSTFYYTALLILLVLMPGGVVITPAYAAGTLTVLNTNDSGPGSLRQAISDAAAGDTIVFDPSLSGATIRLQQTLYVIDKNLTIDGSALASKITISGDSDGNGAGDVRVFVIGVVTVTLKSLIITKGNTDEGGGISNSGALTLINCTVSENTSSDGGGGIISYGSLTIINSTISNNKSNKSSNQGGGGGIASLSGALTITGSTISGNNNASSEGGGIWIGPFNTDTATITGSTISNNTAFSKGGGIYDDSGPELTVINSTISGNTATAQPGGGIYGGSAKLTGGGSVKLTGSTVSGNKTPESAGAGLYILGDTTTITNSTIANNTAFGNAGGIFVYQGTTLTISGSTLSGNQAGSNSRGGAILNRPATLNPDGTTTPGATTTIINSTLSGNSAGYGGGIDNAEGATLNLSSVTMSGNQSPYMGGIGGLLNLGVLNFVNTLIANSTNGDCLSPAVATISINSGNIVQDGQCDSAAVTDVKLGPLANNGGPTKTHALLVGSPAIDQGDASYCDDNPGANNRDQRGVARPIDGDTVPGAICDIGAFEAPPDPTIPVIQFTQATYTASEGTGTSQSVILTRTGTLTSTSQVQVSLSGGTAIAGTDYSSAGFPRAISFGSGVISQTVPLILIDDTEIEPLETINLTVTSLGNAVIGPQGDAVLQLADDDTPSYNVYLPLVIK